MFSGSLVAIVIVMLIIKYWLEKGMETTREEDELDETR